MILFEERRFRESLVKRLRAGAGEAVAAYWLGQAGFAIRHAGRLVLVDPYLSDSLAEKYRGKAFSHERLMPPPATVEALPRVDLVLCTHQHTDHMDPETLAPLARRNPDCRFVVPRAALPEALARIGVDEARLIALDAAESAEPLPGWRVAAVRAAHETLERTADSSHRFLGYVLEVAGVRIYHSGDTVLFDGLEAEVASHAPDLVMLPVNGRSPELTAGGIAGNLDVGEAIALSQAVGASAALLHHYGMFAFNTASPSDIDATVAAAGGSCAARLVRARTGVEYILRPD